MKLGKVFAPEQESILNHSLHQAKLLSFDVSSTNLVWDNPNLDSFWRGSGAKGDSQLKKPIKDYREDLKTHILRLSPDVIVTLGEFATYGLTGKSSITKIRGYPIISPNLNLTIIPTLHPRNMTYSNYIWRYYLSKDLDKARRLCDVPEKANPSFECIIPSSFSEAGKWLDYYARQERVSFDIEVSNYEVSCIGLSDHSAHGVSIPIDSRWSDTEEVQIWIWIAKILENPNITKIGQNLIFDIHFLAQRMGIFVRGRIEDTMIGHHIMYPDFLKGLNFLGSIYTEYPYWKDELHEKSIKEDN